MSHAPGRLGQDAAVRTAPNEEGNVMADLIAIGYPDETIAAAADEARRLADLIIQPDAIA